MTTTIGKTLNKNFLVDLENLFQNINLLQNFPILDGKNIKINKFEITETKNGYFVFDIEQNKKLYFFYSKRAALAMVQNKIKKYNLEKEILDLDRLIDKYDTDCVFYRHSIKYSKNRKHKIGLSARLDWSNYTLDNARLRLKEIIFA